MRHRNKVKKMGRTSSHRSATLRNLASALFAHKQIRTTLTKAKVAQSYVDRLISYGKKDTVHTRRLAFKLLQNRSLVKTLFDDVGPTYAKRNGGYTRVVKLGMRRGDGAAMALLQLVGFEPLKIEVEETAEKAPKKKKATPGKKAVPDKKAAAETKGTEDKATQTTPDVKSVDSEAEPKAPKVKAKKAATKKTEAKEAPPKAKAAAPKKVKKTDAEATKAKSKPAKKKDE